jgi:hypothetical protein|tara:strand:- start:180 stop:638 length:459 start_codon:yes stop_codon:yes gene_type:complete
MRNRLLPSSFDNNFYGHPASLWLFYLITTLTLGRSLAHVFLPDGGAQSIATIPLNQYSMGAGSAVITIFALWGLSQLLIAIVMLIATLRYRSMIPLLYLFLFVEYIGRVCVGIFKPLETLQTPPGATANIVILSAVLLGMFLSLKTRDEIKS